MAVIGMMLSRCDHHAVITGDYALEVVEAQGIVLTNDSLELPKSVPALPPSVFPVDKYVVAPTPTNVLPVSKPQVRTAGVPTVIASGPERGWVIDVVPAVERPVLKGLPQTLPVRKDAGVDPNPQNFSSFSKLRGVSGSGIQGMIEDRRGDLWFSDLGRGLTRYDGRNFTVFTEEEGLGHFNANTVQEDSQGNLWTSSWGGGITRFDGKYFTHFTTTEGLPGNYITAIGGDRQGNLWISAYDGGLVRYDGVSFTRLLETDGLAVKHILDIFEDADGQMWFGTDGSGVLRYDGKELVNFTFQQGLSHDVVTCITQDTNGSLWFGTRGGGVSRYDGTHFTNYTVKEGLVSDLILSILGDSEGNVWFGSQPGGVTKYDGVRFEHFAVIKGLPDNRVRAICEDAEGNIWFATDDDDISKYGNRNVKHFTEKGPLNPIIYDIVSDKNGTLWMSTQANGIASFDGEHFTVVSKDLPAYAMNTTGIIRDQQDDIWFSSWGGLFKYDGETFSHFTDREGLSGNHLYCILEDSAGNIWVGTNSGGVTKYDGERFTHYSKEHGLSHNVVVAITEDRAGNLWFATIGGGVTKYDGTHFTHFTEASGLGSNVILCLEEDRSGNLWFGTGGGGVTRYDGKYFTRFTEREGLSSNGVGSILEDSSGDIWFGTRRGLSVLRAAKRREITEKNAVGTLKRSEASTMICTYDEGVVGSANRVRKVFADRKGFIWVAEQDRLSVFHPAEARPDTAVKEVRLRDVSLHNEPVNWAAMLENKDSVFTIENGLELKHFALSGTVDWQNVPENLSLAHNNNHLTFTYSGNKERTKKYQYQLGGLDEAWNAPTTDNSASYRNLPPGDYIFKVKATDGSGVWSDELQYPFTIRHPWWQAWWAYLLYTILLGGSLYLVYAFQLEQRLQRAEAVRLKEFAALKTRLYTNIMHEFRTPLTVILGMAEQALDNPQKYLREGMSMITRQGQHVLLLVDQMLELSKLQSDKLNLNWQRGDVIPFLDYVAEGFHSLADAKDIQLRSLADTARVILDYDEVRLQQVVSNLLSNAIKFTPRGGHVYLCTAVTENSFVLRVKDTGIGIAAEDLPRVFDRFFQADPSATRPGEGTGIGLTLTRELVRLMEGHISVKSQPGEGTEFTVTWPIRQAKAAHVERARITPTTNGLAPKGHMPGEVGLFPEAKEGIPEQQEGVQGKPLILLADDNEDVRNYLTICLRDKYALAVAKDGQACEEIAVRTIPDLIILDVMMPRKNGFAVCNSLKTDEPTSHIPIIMLTARADIDSKLEGLQQGADDYLTKPFNKRELLLRIENLLDVRRQLQRHYRSLIAAGVFPVLTAAAPRYSETQPEAGNSPSHKVQAGTHDQSIPLAGSLDHAFVRKVSKLIESHLDDTQFTVAVLCRLLALSHSQVHRKLSALTGLSVTHFIRYVRLRKAKAMLLDSGFTIAAIAHDCGFTDPAYFSRVFKREFGRSPRRWREENATIE